MGSVWKRLQRVNKRAAKFQFTSSYHELRLETTAKWRPSNLSVVWTRRSRRVASAPLPWEPDMMNPLVGHITWPVPDNHAISVTLFKDPRTHELEDKDWTFVIEDITVLGKKRVLASASINMRKYASIESTQQSFTLSLKPSTRKIVSADIELTISCVFLREGKATDEDMQSIVSLMSVNNNCDVAPLDDLEDIPDLESSGDISDHLFDFTHQLELMTTSLNGCIDLPTPLSDYQANFDFDDTLKTPSANQQPIQQTPQQERMTSIEVAPPTAATATATATALTPVKPLRKVENSKQGTAKSVFSKIFTSTPIAAEQQKIEQQSISNNGISATTTTARKSLDFDKNADAEEISPVKSVKEPAQPITNHKSYTENSTVVLTDKITTTTTTTPTTAGTIVTTTNNLFTSSSKDEEWPTKNATTIATTTATTVATTVTTATNNATTTPSILQKQTSRTEAMRAELQPLNLKKSYDTVSANNTTTSSTLKNNISSVNNKTNNNNNNNSLLNKPVEKIILKENTPGQDLLEWCKEVTKDYPNVKVTNLTTSWRNGMAFCAIIHHFESELIDMTKVTAHDVVGNCRTAFDAAETLGIPRVIEPRDMSLLAVPDKLAVMTYLHQLRAHFTGKQLQIEQIGSTSDESSYVIGNYKSDNLSQNLLNLSHLKAQLLHHHSIDDDIFGGNDKSQLSPTAKKDVKNIIYNGSKTILGKVLSPTKDKNSINASQHASNPTSPNAAVDTDVNVTLSEMNNQENVAHNQLQQQSTAVPHSPTSLDPNTANKIMTRHKEMTERAKMMMEKLKISTNGERYENDEERQQRLREQARRLILETRTKATNGGPHNNHETPTSPTKLKRFNFSPERTISPIHNGYEDYVHGGGGSGVGSGSGAGSGSGNSGNSSPKVSLSPTKKITPPRDIGTTSSNKISPSHRLSTERFNVNSPLQSFNAVMERISPKNEKKGDKLSYIESELEALEREQEAIDQKASSLEKKLRDVMGGNPKSEETEEQLLSQWFTLVNKKNALLRRQMQLNILEQESDLERKYTMLNQELRAAQSVEDWRKTEAQREKERLLLEELVAIVDKRDQLVQHLHNQEIAIEDDHEIARELEQVDISGGKDKCVLQ